MYKRKDNYSRVDSRLRVPAVTFECANRRVPVDVGEAHELRDGRLLLGGVCWRHLVLVVVVSTKLRAVNSMAGKLGERRCGVRKVRAQQE